MIISPGKVSQSVVHIFDTQARQRHDLAVVCVFKLRACMLFLLHPSNGLMTSVYGSIIRNIDQGFRQGTDLDYFREHVQFHFKNLIFSDAWTLGLDLFYLHAQIHTFLLFYENCRPKFMCGCSDPAQNMNSCHEMNLIYFLNTTIAKIGSRQISPRALDFDSLHINRHSQSQRVYIYQQSEKVKAAQNRPPENRTFLASLYQMKKLRCICSLMLNK